MKKSKFEFKYNAEEYTRKEKFDDNLQLIKQSPTQLLNGIDEVIYKTLNDLITVRIIDEITMDSTILNVINLFTVREKVVSIYCNQASNNNEK